MSVRMTCRMHRRTPEALLCSCCASSVLPALAGARPRQQAAAGMPRRRCPQCPAWTAHRTWSPRPVRACGRGARAPPGAPPERMDGAPTSAPHQTCSAPSAPVGVAPGRWHAWRVRVQTWDSQGGQSWLASPRPGESLTILPRAGARRRQPGHSPRFWPRRQPHRSHRSSCFHDRAPAQESLWLLRIHTLPTLSASWVRGAGGKSPSVRRDRSRCGGR